MNMPHNEDAKKNDRELLAMAEVFGDRSYYVGVTRASHDIQIVTNDVVLAQRAITEKLDKSTVIEAMNQEVREQAIQHEQREI